MNLTLNQPQKQEKLKKSTQKQKKLSAKQGDKQPKQQVATALLSVDQQLNKQSCCSLERQEYPEIKNGITAEKLLKYPELADLSELDRKNIAEMLILFSHLTYALFSQK